MIQGELQVKEFSQILQISLILEATFGVQRSSRPEVFCKNYVLKNSQSTQKNTYARVYF